jgi:hypothetical protein
VRSAPSSYLDWIAKNGVTQFYGPSSIGKTTILRSLRDNWPGSSVLFQAGSVPKVDTEENPFSGRKRITATTTAMDTMLKALGILLKKLLTEDDLVMVDDTAQFALFEDGIPGGTAQAWGAFLRFTRQHKITVVLGTQTRRFPSEPFTRTDNPTVMSYSTDIRYELQEIARSTEGVIVEVITRKSRREIADTVKGRLWVRPTHATPVRST